MKKLLFVLCSLLFVISGMAQSRRYYCEMIGRQTGFDSEKKVAFDFGTAVPRDLWGNVADNLQLVDESGKVIKFRSMIEALNFMSDKKWNFLQAYSSYIKDCEFSHFLLYKDASSVDEAKEGLMTREDWDQTHHSESKKRK